MMDELKMVKGYSYRNCKERIVKKIIPGFFYKNSSG